MSVNTAKQKMGFQAETKQLLHMMVHSLYSNKEIFLRELISNASDACDKLRFLALSNSALYENEPELKVWVNFDKDARTITIRDNGIGMSTEEVIQNLGTIAKSGTKEFMSKLTGEKAHDSQLIGQFGVGFYSAFIVADLITVRTRKAGQSPTAGVKWTSNGEGEFEIEPIVKNERGTEIELHLKEQEDEFLNSWHLRHVITKYSDHISLPIVMPKETSYSEDENKETTEAKVVDIPEEEVINKATALWTLPKQEISEEQYAELYKSIAHDFEAPLAYSHNNVEGGKTEYTSVLFIPARAPFDMWHSQKSCGLKLYVQRVFILDDSEQFLPMYLRFVKGIIDSKDLPLNVSREILQGNKLVDTMRSTIVKRVLSMIESLANDSDQSKFEKFWENFGQVLKEGPAEDFANKDRIAKLLRFASSANDHAKQNVSLEQYIARMQPGQDKIYYVAADSYNAANNSPHLEIFRKKGIEVLILSDRIDEWLMSHLTEFDKHKFQSVARGGFDLNELGSNEEKEENAKQATEFSEVISKIKEILKDRVKEVRTTMRLTESPACIVTDENDMSAHMERIMRAAGQNIPTRKPILELNPQHMLVKNLMHEDDQQRFEELTQVLLDQAILAEGGQLDNPAAFVRRFNKLLLELSPVNS
jgi:molecular chaperone HtpG